MWKILEKAPYITVIARYKIKNDGVRNSEVSKKINISKIEFIKWREISTGFVTRLKSNSREMKAFLDFFKIGLKLMLEIAERRPVMLKAIGRDWPNGYKRSRNLEAPKYPKMAE